MAAKKLNQVVAIRQNVAGRVVKDATEVYRTLQTPALFEGFVKKYHPTEENGETFADEAKKVQFNAEDQLKKLADIETELYDVELTADAANCNAKADIVVDGKIVATGVPVTTLMFLEKKLKDVRQSIAIAPELSTDEDWTKDPSSGLFKTEPRKTHRTKKVQKALVLYAHSDKHPAQTQLIAEDMLVGEYELVKHSGGIEKTRKDELTRRANKLIDAVNIARELANMSEAPELKVGNALFSYLLA